MKKKVRLTALAAAGILASLSVSMAGVAYGASATRAQALDTATGYVPSGSTHQSTQEDSGKYEMKFYNDSHKEKYEVEVSKSTGSLISFESGRYDSRGSGVVKLSEEEAKKPVIGEIPDAKILSVTLDYDDGKEYDVRFRTDSYYGTYAIHGENGTILERDIRVGSQDGTHDVPESLDAGQAISRERVTQLAQEKVPGATVTELELDHDDGRAVYEGSLRKGRWEYEFTIDAVTGEFWEWEEED